MDTTASSRTRNMTIRKLKQVTLTEVSSLFSAIAERSAKAPEDSGPSSNPDPTGKKREN